MAAKILDISIPLTGAVIFWLLYAEKLPMKKDRDGHKRLYEKAENFLLFMAVALSLACVLIAVM